MRLPHQCAALANEGIVWVECIGDIEKLRREVDEGDRPVRVDDEFETV